MKELFITATDTDAGKTFVSCALIHALAQQATVAAFKPVAAGCEIINGDLINEDAKLLCDFSNVNQSIKEINPIAFAEAIAPHIAAKKNNQIISIPAITKYYQQVKSLSADFTLVEGAGGWRLPLGIADNKHRNIEKNKDSLKDNTTRYQFLSDFVKDNKLDVILIVNMKLGCLNHALLTYEAIKRDGLQCIAWVANCASNIPMDNLSENITELEQLLPIPKIAQFNFYNDIDEHGQAVTLHNKIVQAATKINLTPFF